MGWTASRKRNVALLVLLFNPLHGVLKKWSNVMPEGWEVLPYLINFGIAAVALFVIYRYTSPNQKFPLWLIPSLLLALALSTYLRW
jgi:uncharacterized BrkB/YihY/UPF0761 family membrane protein